ncbi:Arm DNA-binding domain-containing protein, partial [Escherichia coli]|uniref:Arm DNA-binding domain-containing protein n=1 Tax=Escherichia coli TaxID=562 RepID=UPI0039BF1833
MALSDVKVRSAKPEAKAYKLTDGDGMVLLVHPNGSKYWRLRYRFGGKEKMLALGKYPEVSLADAREGANKQVISSQADSLIKI